MIVIADTNGETMRMIPKIIENIPPRIIDPLRLKILCALGEQEVSVQDIVEIVGTSQSNISQHLAILRDKDILSTRKDANRVYYKIGDPRLLQLISMMRSVFCTTHD